MPNKALSLAGSRHEVHNSLYRTCKEPTQKTFVGLVSKIHLLDGYSPFYLWQKPLQLLAACNARLCVSVCFAVWSFLAFMLLATRDVLPNLLASDGQASFAW